MSTDSSSSKPRILMLHGGGVSGDIFSIQSRKVVWRLKPYFDFVFLDAPWACPPGPGVLPVFADAGPFYRWARWHDGEDGSKLTERLHETMTQPGGEWVGVIGFSQGGRLATGLCWEQEHGEKGLDVLVPGIRLKFAALIGASWPILLLAQDTPTNGEKTTWDMSKRGQREDSTWDSKFEASISVPSVHLIGKSDQVAEMARVMVKCFDQGKVKLLEPDIGHCMPLDEGENGQLCDAILEAYKLGGGIVQDHTD